MQVILSVLDETYHHPEDLAKLTGRKVNYVLVDILLISLQPAAVHCLLNEPITKKQAATIAKLLSGVPFTP